MTFFTSLTQNTDSPIKKRGTLRVMSYLSGIAAIVLTASPYIQDFTTKRDEVTTRQTAQLAQKQAIDQIEVDKQSADRTFQIELEQKRNRSEALRKVGITFVDPAPIKDGMTILQNGSANPMPKGTVIEDIEGNRAIVMDKGRAKLLRSKP
ncbi:MAG: hypothetical protein KME18_18145 [Phormidium tanganyikae FI6-MK23]|jgi:hypothetical protein|nr:hypothetical protein [Phormidium tanganyikae FI6-MK23]